MKIACMVDEYPPYFLGGLGTYARELSRECTRMGHEITIFSRNRGADPLRDVCEGIEVHRPYLMNFTGVLPIVVPPDVQRWSSRGQEFFQETLHYNFMAASELVNQLVRVENRSYDIVVAHDWLSAMAGIMAKRNLNLPFVFHFHSSERGRTGNGSETIREIERIAAQEADRIITVSYAMRDELVRQGIRENDIRVVYPGVDTHKYRPDIYTADEIRAIRDEIGVGRQPMILYVGRLAWTKGVDSLIRAMPIIRSGVPDAKLVILGCGEEEQLLGHLVQCQCADAVITNLSYVEEEERIRYYAACDVAVFPSKYEPFGLAATEAMAMGKPVVVGGRGTSGMREQVICAGEHACGFHINPNDPADIATFTVRLLKDADLRAAVGRAARARVEEHFTWHLCAQRTLEVYRGAIDVHRRATH
ncbi:MAG TPA: glycosyltransferase family 1 protein [Methanoculleus sp.]|nr:glycosyltransferase family 1 protein [Methanoculleus sp.]